jgi:hypothetical protein
LLIKNPSNIKHLDIIAIPCVGIATCNELSKSSNHYAICPLTNLSNTKLSTTSPFKLSITSFWSLTLCTSSKHGPTSPTSKRLLSAIVPRIAPSARASSAEAGGTGVHSGARCSSDRVNEMLNLCRIESI